MPVIHSKDAKISLKGKPHIAIAVKHPYTALCVDVFSEDENQNGLMVTKYINKDGLRGNYSVYIEYNGKLYNTGKYFNAN